jgi:DNA polymerase I
MQKILLLDMINAYVRNFSALSLTNDNGEHVGGLFGTLQTIVTSINKFNPDIVFCAWEGKGSSERRRKILKEYKEGRKFVGFNRMFDMKPEEEREAFRLQLGKLHDVLQILPVYQGSVDFLEADDLIAYLCRKTLKDHKFKKIIVSSDRDYIQLVNDSTMIHRPVKTKTCKDGEIVTFDKVDFGYNIVIKTADNFKDKELIPCHPSNYYLTKCIGESTDNIGGIKGIGIKTFLKDFNFLVNLKESGDNYTIKDLLEYAEEHNGDKRYQKYISDEHKELLLRNEQLIQLLEPDISLKSVQSIENIINNDVSKFNPTQFLIKLKKENISPTRIEKWITTFNSVKNNKFEIGE